MQVLDLTPAAAQALIEAEVAAGMYAHIGIYPPADATAEAYPVHTVDDLRALPPVEHLVDPYIVRGVNFTVAQPGGFKTFTALAWSFDVPGPVLYVTREGLAGIPLRMDAHAAVTGQPLPVMRFLTDADLALPGEADRVIATGEAMRSDTGAPVLIVIDTLNDATGVDENGPEMKAAYQAVRRIQGHFQNAVLANVHTGWDATRERGHSSIRGVSDNTMLLEKNESSGTARLTCLKVRDGAPFPPEYWRLEIPEGGGTPWLVPGTEAEWKDTGKDKLRDRADRLRLEFGEGEFDAEGAADVLNVTPATARKHLGTMAEKYMVLRVQVERVEGQRGNPPARWKMPPPLAPEWTPVST